MGKASRSRASKSTTEKAKNKNGGNVVAASNALNGVGSEISRADLDFSMPENAYSGTFRWAVGKKFMKLPAAREGAAVDCSKKGWGPWLSSRVPDPGIIERVKADPSALDGLTYPVTAAFVLKGLQYKCSEKSELTVVVLGAASRAEERVARETAYWGEIAVCLQCRIHLVMCGPEVSTDGTLPNPNPNTRITLFRGTFLGYQSRHNPSADNTVLITYNGGFGNFVESNRFDLLESWHDDLRAIVASGIQAIFTQANDYADLNGETALMAHIFGAQFVTLPTQNPFSAASHLSEPDRPDAWACANFSFYAVQGCDTKRATLTEVDTQAGRQKLRKAVAKAVEVGCDMAGLQAMMTRLIVSSPVPDMAGGNGPNRSSQRVTETKTSASTGTPQALIPTGQPTKKPTAAVQVECLGDRVCVTVDLPLLRSAASLDLELVGQTLTVSFDEDTYQALEIQLPDVRGGGAYSEDTITAKFDKATQKLAVVCGSVGQVL